MIHSTKVQITWSENSQIIGWYDDIFKANVAGTWEAKKQRHGCKSDVTIYFEDGETLEFRSIDLPHGLISTLKQKDRIYRNLDFPAYFTESMKQRVLDNRQLFLDFWNNRTWLPREFLKRRNNYLCDALYAAQVGNEEDCNNYLQIANNNYPVTERQRKGILKVLQQSQYSMELLEKYTGENVILNFRYVSAYGKLSKIENEDRYFFKSVKTKVKFFHTDTDKIEEYAGQLYIEIERLF